MHKRILNNILSRTNSSRRTVSRLMDEFGIDNISAAVETLIVIYLEIKGEDKYEKQEAIKMAIHKEIEVNSKVASPSVPVLDPNKVIELLEKQLNAQQQQNVQMLKMIDDMNMLRVEDKGIITRLHDKNVLGDLLTELEPGTDRYNAIESIYKYLNKNS